MLYLFYRLLKTQQTLFIGFSFIKECIYTYIPIHDIHNIHFTPWVLHLRLQVYRLRTQGYRCIWCIGYRLQVYMVYRLQVIDTGYRVVHKGYIFFTDYINYRSLILYIFIFLFVLYIWIYTYK